MQSSSQSCNGESGNQKLEPLARYPIRRDIHDLKRDGPQSFPLERKISFAPPRHEWQAQLEYFCRTTEEADSKKKNNPNGKNLVEFENLPTRELTVETRDRQEGSDSDVDTQASRALSQLWLGMYQFFNNVAFSLRCKYKSNHD